MKRLLVTLVLSALIAVAVVPAMAQGAPPPASVVPGASGMNVPAPCISSAMRLIHPRMMSTLESRLQLTAEQKVKVNSLLNKSEEDGTQLVLAQRKAAEEFATTLAKPNSTEPEITAAAKKAMDAETAIITAKARTMIELRSMLTDEQKKAFAELLDQHTMMWRTKPGTRPTMTAPAPPADAVK